MKKDQEYEKARVFIIVEIIEYVPNSVVIKTILKKSTGNVSAVSFDSGEGFAEKTSPFDTFIQVLEGRAEIIIDSVSHDLQTGQSITIPAHTRNMIIANERFKMISTVIKSGYENIAFQWINKMRFQAGFRFHRLDIFKWALISPDYPGSMSVPLEYTSPFYST